VVVYLLFSRYISCSNFWHVSSIHVLAIDFRRGRDRTLQHSMYYYSTPHIVWSVYRVSRVDRVIYTVYPL